MRSDGIPSMWGVPVGLINELPKQRIIVDHNSPFWNSYSVGNRGSKMFKSKCTKISITKKRTDAFRKWVIDVIPIDVVIRFVSQIVSCYKAQRTDIQRVINIKNWKNVRAREKIGLKQQIRVIGRRDV